MSCVRVGLAAIAVTAGLGMSSVGTAADDDAVFFSSDDCSGEGYVWDVGGMSRESIGWNRPVPASQVVGTHRLVYVPDPASSPAIVEYQSRLVPGGCVVQPGSDHLVRAIPMGPARVSDDPFLAQDLR